MQNKLYILKRIVLDPEYRFWYFAYRGYLGFVSAEKFVKRMYRYKMGCELNLKNPMRYTEKLQWLKLYDHQERYTAMVDKYSAKKIVAEKIGQEYVVPLLGMWERAEDINFDILPQKFVLKTTHDSGGVVICKSKNELNINEVKSILKKSLKRKYYNFNREWPYKDVKPRIIAEKYLEDTEYNEIRDYKFFTFGGEPKVVYIAQGRGTEETKADFFDMDFNHLEFSIDHERADVIPKKPQNFELMKELAKKLAEGTPQLRVDFYEVNGKVYFGEMTFFHCSGWMPFHPGEWDEIFGRWLVLPNNVCNN